MDAIDESIGALLGKSRLRRQALFYSLFTACYDHAYGLGSDYKSRRAARSLPADLSSRFKAVNSRIVKAQLPEKVMDAMDKATADIGRRTTRHKFFMEQLGLVSAK